MDPSDRKRYNVPPPGLHPQSSASSTHSTQHSYATNQPSYASSVRTNQTFHNGHAVASPPPPPALLHPQQISPRMRMQEPTLESPYYQRSHPSSPLLQQSSGLAQLAYAPQPHPQPHPQTMLRIATPVGSPSHDPFYLAPDSASAYGPQVRIIRKKTVKHIPLKNGNLVIDCPVPDRLMNNVPLKHAEEFTSMRYTAVTCDPDEFASQGYTLRSQIYQRPTELFIVMTMYNEDEILFTRSMTSVMKNIAYLCSRKRSTMWGPEGWKKVVVCIVSDGRNKIHPRVLETLGVMGVYQDDVAKSEVNGKPVEAHLYEYTTQVCVDSDMRVRGSEKGMVPVQILFCLKEQNKKKINSHRWFFNAFAPLLHPNVCILIDVGTKPTHTSIYQLWKEFDMNPNVGGACGEIAVDTGRGCFNLVNPLVAAQNFEYKMSNILDKPLESVFGFISVLPGAFSAYRYQALLNTAPGVGPLASYFYGEKLHNGSESIFKANMYLAEDRILCFELVAKANSRWVLKYVKAARADTDVPDGVPEFISQRRRWLNGSFFASVYALVKWWQIWRTNHSFVRKLMFQVQLFYNIISLIFSWFTLGNFYLTFFYLSQTFLGENSPLSGAGQTVGSILFQFFRQVYIFAIVVIFVVSLGNRPAGSKLIYTFCMLLFALIMGLMLFLSGWTVYQSVNENIQKVVASTGQSVGSVLSDAILNNAAFRDLCISMLSTYGLYIIASVVYFEPWHMLTSFIQYIFLLPSFVNILMVYAFCNTHDISWGTKGDNKPSDLGAAKKVSNENQKNEHVEVELPFEDHQDKATLNAVYDKWLRNLPNRTKEVHQKRDQKTKLDDMFRNYRTNLVLMWIMTNALLIILLTNEQVLKWMGADNGGSNFYLAFIFWTVAGLALVRFIGSMIYIFGHWFTQYGMCRTC